MPQLNQLSDVLLSQLFWLAIALGFIFFVIARGMVPKIQATVDQREQQIADDLAAAAAGRGGRRRDRGGVARADGRQPRRGREA